MERDGVSGIVIPSINSVCVFLRPVYFAIHSQTDVPCIR
jgi:hypothetical protein